LLQLLLPLSELDFETFGFFVDLALGGVSGGLGMFFLKQIFVG
jgi:hypothetical protein